MSFTEWRVGSCCRGSVRSVVVTADGYLSAGTWTHRPSISQPHCDLNIKQTDEELFKLCSCFCSMLPLVCIFFNYYFNEMEITPLNKPRCCNAHWLPCLLQVAGWRWVTLPWTIEQGVTKLWLRFQICKPVLQNVQQKEKVTVWPLKTSAVIIAMLAG